MQSSREQFLSCHLWIRGSSASADRRAAKNLTTASMCASVDTDDSSHLGFELKLGHSKALRSLCMCVCIFMQGFEVVLLNASFGCIGKLFFNLAWQAYGLGFASAYRWVSIDVWDWGLWSRGFYLRCLFDRAAPALGYQPGTPPPTPQTHTTMPIEFSHSLTLTPCQLWCTLTFICPSGKTNAHTLSHTFCPVDFPLSACCVSAPLLSSSPASTSPYPSSSPFPRPPRLSTWLLTL